MSGQGGSAFDQSTYAGRLRYFIELTHPKNLLVTSEQLAAAQAILAKKDAVPATADDIKRAQILVSATLHPDTGEKIPLPFRMSAFVPMNLIVTVGLLLPNPSMGAIVFWQWINQSLNVAINWANANKSNPMSASEVGQGYVSAVLASCTVAVGMNAVAQRFAPLASLTRSVVMRMAPFVAVASAGMLNVFLMRRNELENGIDVIDDAGRVIGKSKTAAFQAVSQVALSRVATAFPVLTIPPLIMSFFERQPYFKARPRALIPLNFGIITVALMGALPCAVALFPQQGRLPMGELEPELMLQVKKTHGPLALPTGVWFNRGL